MLGMELILLALSVLVTTKYVTKFNVQVIHTYETNYFTLTQNAILLECRFLHNGVGVRGSISHFRSVSSECWERWRLCPLSRVRGFG